MHGTIHRFETLPVERRPHIFPREESAVWRRVNLLVEAGEGFFRSCFPPDFFSVERVPGGRYKHRNSDRNSGSKLPAHHGYKSNVTHKTYKNNNFLPFLEVSSQHWRIGFPENKPEVQPFCRRKRHQVLHWCTWWFDY